MYYKRFKNFSISYRGIKNGIEQDLHALFIEAISKKQAIEILKNKLKNSDVQFLYAY